jgi:hypothetical protein
MTMSTVTPRTHHRTTSYGSALSVILAVAFALSATHTAYAYASGLQDPGFNLTTPAAWVFYAVGFAAAALSRRESRWAQVALLAYLGLLLVVAVFYYPTTFTVRQQTVFGWFENDVYTGLLMIAAYLSVLRLRSISLVVR